MRHLINGLKIDLIRRNLGLTHAEYGARVGVPERTIERICRGENPPSGPTLLRIIRLGGVNPEVLDLDGWGKEGIA